MKKAKATHDMGGSGGGGGAGDGNKKTGNGDDGTFFSIID